VLWHSLLNYPSTVPCVLSLDKFSLTVIPELDIESFVKLDKSIDAVIELVKAVFHTGEPFPHFFHNQRVTCISDSMPRATVVRRESTVLFAGRRAMDDPT